MRVFAEFPPNFIYLSDKVYVVMTSSEAKILPSVIFEVIASLALLLGKRTRACRGHVYGSIVDSCLFLDDNL